MKNKLKPCPFCGEKPKRIIEGEYKRFLCNNFDCWIKPRTDWYADELTAIEAWNRRVSDEILA